MGLAATNGSDAMVGSVPRPGWKHRGDALPTRPGLAVQDPGALGRRLQHWHEVSPTCWRYLQTYPKTSVIGRMDPPKRMVLSGEAFLAPLQGCSFPSQESQQEELSLHNMPLMGGIGAGADHVHPQGRERDSRNQLWKDSCTWRSRENQHKKR